ncbi:MAG: UPF0182 family protein [Chloroflexi bacterium]|nr:UPF0182 family protein [Chloroflexota bacterium]
MRAFVGFLLVVVLPLLLLMGISTIVPVTTEWLWFDSLGLEAVYELQLTAQWGLFWIVTLGTFLFLAGNVFLARRVAPANTLRLIRPRIQKQEVVTQAYNVGSLAFDFGVWSAAGIVSVFVGSMAQESWLAWLRFLNQAPFGVTDPIFGRDIAFYVFDMPVLWFLKDWGLWTLLLTLGATAGVYLASRAARGGSLPRASRVHVAVLGALLFCVLAGDWVLQMFGLLNSTADVVHGAGYADIHARLPIMILMAVFSVIVAGIILVNVLRPVERLTTLAVVLWFIAIPVLVGGWPALVQNLEVGPSELAKEMPYIEYSIQYTRQAYDLDHVVERDFVVTDTLTLADVENNTAIVQNIRLWDYRPLLQTFRQLQEIRTYYEFVDVDVDRYMLDGEYREVMLAARELVTDQLPENAQTWVNERLIYTHGYGVCLNAVSEFTQEGQPRFLVHDIPPASADPALRIDQPAIYYGETVSDYAIVHTTTPEFDYPKGNDNVYASYQGTGGVLLDSPLTRLLFALRYEASQIILSEYITPQSRLMMHRVIGERVRAVAPFFRYDRDPYMVVAQGRLYWIQDAYTVTDRYPYAESRGSFNYIRNSVKVVIDPYNGSMVFYVMDDQDPLTQAYARAFPTLFQPGSALPADLRAHLRYPEGLFTIQASLYATYHMGDPQVFYNKEDLWAIPNELYSETALPLEPYYVILKLADDAPEEFLIMLPFTPAKRDNMIAWFYVQCDGDHYGNMGVFKFSKERLVYGPMQIESRINQVPNISQQLSLWNQRGSQVIRGNLLVIPIEQSLLYVEPLYLQSESSQIPELKRVIVAYGNRIAMGDTLQDALAQALTGTEPAIPPVQPPTGTETDWMALAQSAKSHYDAANLCLQQNDWACFGREMDALKRDLEALYALAIGQ